MNTKLRIEVLNVIALAAVLILVQGCASAPAKGRIGLQEGRAVVGPGTLQGAVPLFPEPCIGQEAVQVLNTRVASSAGDAQSEAVAYGLVRAVEGSLAEAGFRQDASSPDLQAFLDIEVSLFDQAADYYSYDGRVLARITSVHEAEPGGPRILGDRRFEARQKATLGRDKALDGLTAQLAPEVSSFVKETATPERIRLAARDVALRWGTLRMGASETAAKFVQRVNSYSGVLSCRLLTMEPSTRTMVFRIVYLTDEYPQGILVALATDPLLGVALGR